MSAREKLLERKLKRRETQLDVARADIEAQELVIKQQVFKIAQLENSLLECNAREQMRMRRVSYGMAN